MSYSFVSGVVSSPSCAYYPRWSSPAIAPNSAQAGQIHYAGLGVGGHKNPNNFEMENYHSPSVVGNAPLVMSINRYGQVTNLPPYYTQWGRYSGCQPYQQVSPPTHSDCGCDFAR